MSIQSPRHHAALLVATVLSLFLSPYHVQAQFALPASKYLNPLIGTVGPAPGASGGMIPSVAPPFGATRWTAQNQQNWVSRQSFNWSDGNYQVYGFLGTRQPAIWMGESAWAGVVPGSGERVKTGWDDRAMTRVNGTEQFGVGFYTVELEQERGKVKVEMSATSRVGHFRFTFMDTLRPYIFIPVTRQSTLFHTPNIFNHSYFPTGAVQITERGAKNGTLEVCGSNDELQDQLLAPLSIRENAKNFKGFICARFTAHSSFGITQGNTTREHAVSGSGTEIGAFVRFNPTSNTGTVVNLRIGTSLISMDQARRNIDNEIPDGQQIEETRKQTEAKWAEKVGRFEIDTDDDEAKTNFLTAVTRASQFPYEVHDVSPDGKNRYYSAYDNAIHEGESYNGYSIWDTYRAAWSFQVLFSPERIPDMVRSMLHDFKEGGWLPMWKNIVETNIMVSTHSDSLLAEAIRKGFISAFTEDELKTMWQAVWKDASVAPVNDINTVYSDRQEGVDFEARAGLTTYMNESMGWVAVDVHSESVSRTLDYAYDDHVLSILASLLPSQITALSGKPNVTNFLDARARRNVQTVWNDATGFAQARFLNGSLDPDMTAGFTEGSREVYSLSQALIWGDMIDGLIQQRGGLDRFIQSVDNYFNGPELDFRNEPAHHTPYIYALASPAHARSTQQLVHTLAKANFNNTPQGLSGNDDCGQTSSWYIFSAMGFYSVDPAGAEYIIGSPFFSNMKVHIPKSLIHGNKDPHGAFNATTNSYVLQIKAPGAEKNWFVKDVRVNGVSKINTMRIKHENIVFGGLIEFDMTA